MHFKGVIAHLLLLGWFDLSGLDRSIAQNQDEKGMLSSMTSSMYSCHDLVYTRAETSM